MKRRDFLKAMSVVPTGLAAQNFLRDFGVPYFGGTPKISLDPARDTIDRLMFAWHVEQDGKGHFLDAHAYSTTFSTEFVPEKDGVLTLRVDVIKPEDLYSPFDDEEQSTQEDDNE